MSDTTLGASRQTLSRKWIVPPFSVLDARSGRWLDRNKQWERYLPECRTRQDVKAYGGWSGDDTYPSRAFKKRESVFDPTLAEVLTFWFSAPGDRVLDPFCGHNTKRLVIHAMGRRYFGMDIDEKRHREVAGACQRLPFKKWSFDFCIACPPYGWLEKYTDRRDDLSNMDKTRFSLALSSCFGEIFRVLKTYRFFALVVGDVRDDEGAVFDIAALASSAAKGCHLDLHAKLVFLTRCGSAALRTKHFANNRRPVGTHQYVLVFSKGDPRELPEQDVHRFPWDSEQGDLFELAK